MHGPVGGLTFAGHIALYPTCNRVFIEGLDVADKPIRIFHGAADDYVPAAGCRAYVERLRKVGKDISLTEYPGAHHVFDNPALKNPVKLPQAQTTRGCPMDCSFCSVTAFNGRLFRMREVDEVVAEVAAIPERDIIFVDDDLNGFSRKAKQRCLDLFRAMAQARLDKQWITQVTINFGDDDELPMGDPPDDDPTDDPDDEDEGEGDDEPLQGRTSPRTAPHVARQLQPRKR